MAKVNLTGVAKSFATTRVIEHLDLTIEDGEFLTLVGPSGCGKSTLLRIIAGLEQQSGGSVSIDNTIVDTIRPSERNLAMVFQSYALYPHLTVFDNIAVPLRMRQLTTWQRLPLAHWFVPGTRQAEADIAERVREAATTLGLQELLNRNPGELSGGQRQRVAVGRAIVRHPAAFLFDEPLPNLDAKLRVHMRAEIMQLHRQLDSTFIYVTHDRAEAMTMSDRIVVIVVPASVALGLCSALLIDSLRAGRDIYKTIYFLPVMAALLAMAIVWEFTLHPTIGLINDTLTSGCDVTVIYKVLSGAWYGGNPTSSWYGSGCENGFPLWLGDKQYTMGTLAFIGIWQSFGFNMVLYLAGLTSVPSELYRAAEMDGASSAWARFRLVTWPLLGPTTVFVVTITLICSFQVFDTVEALTLGGPVKSTYVMMYAIYEKAIKHNLVGMGSAITVVFLLFVMVLTMLQRYLVERRVHYA